MDSLESFVVGACEMDWRRISMSMRETAVVLSLFIHIRNPNASIYDL